MLEQQQTREFGQTREPEERIRHRDYREDEISQEEQGKLINRYGAGLGIAVYDFGQSAWPERIKILAEQAVIKSDQGSQQDRAIALAALLEAVVLRAYKDKFGF